MYQENDNLIDQLRKEANDVKSCFTTFSFQAVAFSIVVLGAIIKFQPDQPYVGFAGLLIIIILLTVCRVGNYKFATANRHFGFELYLDFVKSKNPNYPYLIRNIGWEAALRAWRVVQPTIFDEIYYTKLNTSIFHFRERWNYNKIKKRVILNKLRKKVMAGAIPPNFLSFKFLKKHHIYKKFKKRHKWWFNPSSLVKSHEAKWYPGSYLHTMQNILETIALISIIPLVATAIQFQQNPNFNKRLIFEQSPVGELAIITWLIISLSIIMTFVNIRHINTRRKVLESGLLSIHSCAVIWQVVLLAHSRALTNTGSNQNLYLKNLAKEAESIKQNVNNIYVWISNVNKNIEIYAIP